MATPKINHSAVISCSRRTDIPRFYMPWLVKHLKSGVCKVANPRSGYSFVSLSKEHVVCLALWSKDYAEFIKAYEQDPQLFAFRAMLFNFTITGLDTLESKTINVDDAIAQANYLADHFGQNSVIIRFDPIVFWKTSREADAPLFDNLDIFAKLVAGLKGFAFITAFYINYPRVAKRMNASKIYPEIPTFAEQVEVVQKLAQIAEHGNVKLALCCLPELSKATGVPSSACIDGATINEILALHNKPLLSLRKDGGQRADCRCVVSRDIGSYDKLCGHNCLYCYARPEMDGTNTCDHEEW